MFRGGDGGFYRITAISRLYIYHSKTVGNMYDYTIWGGKIIHKINLTKPLHDDKFRLCTINT